MQPNNQSEGLAEELFVAYEAMKKGCNVSFPFGGKTDYDLLIERGGEILKIQVKSGSGSRDPLVQQIDRLDEYTESKVDFFAGIVNLEEVDADEEPSVDGPRHVFYKEFDEVEGQTARVNYRPQEKMGGDSNKEDANLPQEFNFEAKIEPQLPTRESAEEGSEER